jgi:hypothetical protein
MTIPSLRGFLSQNTIFLLKYDAKWAREVGLYYLGVLSSLFMFKNDLTGGIMCMLKQLEELICTTGP